MIKLFFITLLCATLVFADSSVQDFQAWKGSVNRFLSTMEDGSRSLVRRSANGGPPEGVPRGRGPPGGVPPGRRSPGGGGEGSGGGSEGGSGAAAGDVQMGGEAVAGRK